MKNTKLRNQLADCIRYIRQTNEYSPTRPIEWHTVFDECTSRENITLERLFEIAYDLGLDPAKTRVSGYTREDFDGYGEGYVYIEVSSKCRDEEWYDVVCDYIVPQYEQNEYREYLRIKQKYNLT